MQLLTTVPCTASEVTYHLRPDRNMYIIAYIIIIINKKYVLSNSEYIQCNFFISDHVTFIQFKICCCVQNFIEIG